MKIRRLLIGLFCLLGAGTVFIPVSDVMAADASVVFGSDEYENESGSEFPVGVYINGDGESDIGYYKVEIKYDPQRLRYIEGATEGGDGTVIFEGVGNDVSVSTMLQFEALSGGDTQLSIGDTRVLVAEEDNEQFKIIEKATVPVRLGGEDVVAAQTTQATTQESTEATETSETTEAAGNKADSKKISDSEFFWPLVMIIGLGAVLTAILIALGVIKSARRKQAKAEAKKTVYEKLHSEKAEKSLKDDVVAAREAVNKTEQATAATKAVAVTEAVKAVADEKAEPEPAAKPAEKAEPKPAAKPVEKAEPKPAAKPAEKAESKPAAKPAAASKPKPVPKVPEGPPVIEVKDVGMSFRVSNSNTSGFKDYMIQKLRGKIKTKKLDALKDISFNVYKGEVVGIIGTNGSGKSTLLKIVSGALRPTSGEVIADKSKIQLLTLGTGFDGELSARENIYLNGAIIGYTKEFIDKHFDEIIEFAELEDFVDEKVKNFSSGMVSRLGFSIATVGGAAEILILDEVLSVGDQFFRKKSLDRVQKMIHGGSTVLIVSHNMNTIKNHCTKVVWIEKGTLKMVGDPKTVCESYAKSHDVVEEEKKAEKRNEEKAKQ